ncbi:MAG TPA: YfhO family protein [Thermoanaerobaculia bacterium]|nr:YfhO family protein [Thermoanaerobaculia bacterium]
MSDSRQEPRGTAFRRHRFAFALLALLALTLFLPALLKREVFTLRDHFDYFQPLRAFTADELRAGRLPLWNPYSASGEPWLANPQTGVFYPPTWLFLVLPFETAYMSFLMLHLALLGWGAYLLFARRVPPGAAMVGAAALMFSGPVLSLLDVSNNFATFAWIPLVLWCAFEGAWRRGALVLALAFLGAEPFFAAIAALMYAIVRRHRDVLWTALLAFGLSAVQLIPFLEYVSYSDRAGGMEDALILRDSMSARDWLQTLMPFPSAPAHQQFIPVVYLGVVVIALALIGIVVGLRARTTHFETAGWLVLLITAIALSTGPAWLSRMPVTLFRYPARLVPFAALAIAALAVIGWQRLRPDRRWLDLLVLLVMVGDLLFRATPLLDTAPFRRDVVPYDVSIGDTSKVLRFGEVDVNERAAWISGYLNLYDRRFDAFTAAPLASAPYVTMYRKLLQVPTFESFAYAGVSYILTEDQLPLPWYPVTSAGSVRVFRNPQAFPMAAHFAPGSVSLRRGEWKLDTSSARVTITAPSDGTVVLRQQGARGWRVTVDGRPAPALLVDGIFRGVNVAKGRHEIVWTYRPPSLYLGAAMTILTLFAMQISAFVKRRRTRSGMKNFSSGPSNLE